MNINKINFQEPIITQKNIPAPVRVETEEALPVTGEKVSISSAGPVDAVSASRPNVIKQAEKIALGVVKIDTHTVKLDTGESRKILTAGSDHFKSFWTRDACYGLMGIVDKKDGQKLIKDVLQTLFDRSDSSGELPRRQGDYKNSFMLVLSALGMKSPDPKNIDIVEYNNELGAHQFDSTALPIILSAEYYKHSGDKKFIEKNYKAINKSIAWLEKMDTQVSLKLINQPGSGDWKDIVRRSGMVGYTNAQLYGAFKAAAQINRTMGDWEKAEHNEKYAAKIKKEFNAVLWDEKKGWYRDSDCIDMFSPDGNMFAVIYGIADKRQTGRVISKLEDFMNKSSLPFPATEGDYPESMIPVAAKLTGMNHYHDRYIWPWQGGVMAVACVKAGRPDLGKKVLSKIAEQTVKDGSFYEVYNYEGDVKPVRTLVYKSEPDFLWGAGTYLWAARELKDAKKNIPSTDAVPKKAELMEDKGFIIK
ncbi:MAG: glycoside hydrolase family 15 protein [Chloroflexi bacterium]|nr:glycoside hydrolase family 15 protein [Chloroflexota bacterium]